MKFYINRKLSLVLVAATSIFSSSLVFADTNPGVPALPESVQQAPDAAQQMGSENLAVPGQITQTQRDAIRLQIQQKWNSLTPEQQEDVRRNWANQWQNLTPEQREEHNKQYQEFIEQMTPEEREAYNQQMLEKIQSLTPEQRVIVQQQLLERYKTLSPEEQKVWRENIKNIENMLQAQAQALQ